MKGFLDSTLTFYRDMKKQKVVTRSNPAFGKAQDSSFEMDLPRQDGRRRRFLKK